jgi:hypothetical protein
MAPRYPAIPEPTTDPASLRDAVMSLKQAFEILSGQRGAGQDAAVKPSDVDSGLATKVSKSGDTMTGALIVSAAVDYMSFVKSEGPASWVGAYDTSTALEPGFWAGRGDNDRWAILTTPGPDTSGNVGSNLRISRYANDSTPLPDALTINRATGNAVFGGSLIVNGTLQSIMPNFGLNLQLTENTGGWSKYMRCVNGGDLQVVNNANTSVIMTLTDGGDLGALNNVSAQNTSYSGPSGGFNIPTYLGSGSPWQQNMLNANPNFGGVSLLALHYSGVWAGWQFTISSAYFQFHHDNDAVKGGGTTTWTVASDARIKDVKSDYTTGLDAIAALRPVRYVYKHNHSLNAPEIALKSATDPAQIAMETTAQTNEYIGLVAQDAEAVLPDCFRSGLGYIDGKKVEDLRSAEYTPLLFALVNAVKELKARVEELEAA